MNLNREMLNIIYEQSFKRKVIFSTFQKHVFLSFAFFSPFLFFRYQHLHRIHINASMVISYAKNVALELFNVQCAVYEWDEDDAL